MYKLENGQLVQAPNPVAYNGYQIFNPNRFVLVQLGYKELERTEPPQIEPNEELVESYIDEDDKIVQIWSVKKLDK